MFTVNWRRQRPIWMTRGMLFPTGTFESVNVPSNAVYVDVNGLPVTSAEQLGHVLAVKPEWRAATWVGSLGM